MIPNLREAREIWWCEEHNAEGIQNHGASSDECWRAVWADPHSEEGLGIVSVCRMVAKVLVDPALVEWARSLFQECGQCGGSGTRTRLKGTTTAHSNPDYPDYSESTTEAHYVTDPCPACNGSGQLPNEARLAAAAKAIYDAVYPDIDDAWEDTAIYDSPLADRHRREAKAAVLAFLGYEEG